jgi:multidrug efflux pump subunit AcrA (membrane-fusion protein)
MSIEALPQSPDPLLPVRAEPWTAPLRVPRSRSWKRSIMALAFIGCVASVAVVASNVMSPAETGPQLTYTITRGDLVVTVTEQGLVESSENTEIKCRVRGRNAVLWIIESGTIVKKGDELVRLDSAFINEQIDERTKYAHWSQSAADGSAGRLARAKLAVSEYEKGRYVAELMTMEKDVVVAEAKLRTANDRLNHAEVMRKSDYKSDLEVEEKQFAVDRAKLNLKLERTELDVLKRFTLKEESQTLKGNLNSVTATHKANVERATADGSRRDRALQEVKHCVVRAERSGLVIHPSAAKWEHGPIEEGTNVWKDQVLLLMPDLAKMQVKVGVHESLVDRIKKGLTAKVTLPDRTTTGTVSSVAAVTRPAQWWTGNEVTYDTLIALRPEEGLKPGMSAEVEVIIAEYENVLIIPVAAIVETEAGQFCWVKTDKGIRKRPLELGDSNTIFTIVEKGLREGDEVLLNPPGNRGSQPLENQNE